MSVPTAQEWMEFGACKDDAPELYDEYFEEIPPENVKCGVCPVIAYCLTYALKNNYEGVWGGTTIVGRRTLGRRQHRVRCPGRDCKSSDIERARNSDTCLSCGLSWPAPKSR